MESEDGPLREQNSIVNAWKKIYKQNGRDDEEIPDP